MIKVIQDIAKGSGVCGGDVRYQELMSQGFRAVAGKLLQRIGGINKLFGK